MSEWHASIAAFAKENGYRFMGELVFSQVWAPFRGAEVELWISNMGPGRPRASLSGMIAEYGVKSCHARAKMTADFVGEVRRKTLLDRLFSRGVATGNRDFDSRYVALGEIEDVRRFLVSQVVAAFVEMWPTTQGLAVEDGEVTLSGGEFSLDPKELAFVIETVGTIAVGGRA